MKLKQSFTLGSLVIAGIFATGCSQQQIQEAPAATPAPVPVAPAPAPEPAPMKPTPRPTGGNCHTHPANAMTKSVRHCHANPKGRHHYGRKMGAAKPAQPQVDVYALQRKLKAKGYYKGPIDGVVGTATRDALKRFQQR